MARLFWAALGAAAGVYAVRKVTKAAEAYTPTGVAHGLSDFADGLRELADAVREGMSEREDQLRLALGIDAGTDEVGSEGMGGQAVRRLDAETARRLIEDPTGRFDARDARAR